MRFIKMHGLGNDFAIVDLRGGGSLPAPAKIATLANRKTGIGFDQFIAIQLAKGAATDAHMLILNADGSEAESCGNATRCVASLLMEETGKGQVVIGTAGGPIECRLENDGRITADMGVPKFGWRDIPLATECDTLNLPLRITPSPQPSPQWGEGVRSNARTGEGAVGVNIGNPHAVLFVDDVASLDVKKLGPPLENDPLFPLRANIEFAQVISPGEIRMRVWERGAGETMACGSGACAAHVAAVRRGLAGRKARVIMDGGALDFHWREEDDHILMTGPAVRAFNGVVE